MKDTLIPPEGASGRVDRVQHARELRSRSTRAERAMWGLLRKRSLGVKFRRQHPIGPFFADFFCAELGLVLELDGLIHRTQVADDRRRESMFLELGLIVVRLRNDDVLCAPGRTLSLLASIISPLLSRASRALHDNPRSDDGHAPPSPATGGRGPG